MHFADGKVVVRYSAFEMIFRKENGIWKILVDQDTSRNGTITETDFLAAAALKAPDVNTTSETPKEPE